MAVALTAGLLSWFAGRFLRQYRELARAGWERAEQLERERRLVAEQARLRERSRIAQDMHDALGHELSLLALSAGALKLAPGLAPEHREVAEGIRGRAEAAVDRLGEVIGVLRETAGAAPTRPADTSITRLVEEAAASGLAVTAHVAERPAGPGATDPSGGAARGAPHRPGSPHERRQARPRCHRHGPGHPRDHGLRGDRTARNPCRRPKRAGPRAAVRRHRRRDPRGQDGRQHRGGRGGSRS
ncbi:sensor histidine kinase [Streptomyces albus]